MTSVAGEATAIRSKVEGMKGELHHSFREVERLKVRTDKERSGKLHVAMSFFARQHNLGDIESSLTRDLRSAHRK